MPFPSANAFCRANLLLQQPSPLFSASFVQKTRVWQRTGRDLLHFWLFLLFHVKQSLFLQKNASNCTFGSVYLYEAPEPPIAQKKRSTRSVDERAFLRTVSAKSKKVRFFKLSYRKKRGERSHFSSAFPVFSFFTNKTAIFYNYLPQNIDFFLVLWHNSIYNL